MWPGPMLDVAAARKLHGVERRGAMYHWMSGWGWFWMTFMMVFWVFVLGVVVYAGVRLAQRPPGGKHS